MKKIHIIALLFLIVLVTSCFKDDNNYEYAPAEKITVTGINPSYDRITQVDSLIVTPVVTSTDPNAKFQYFWGIYETNVQGFAPKVDTICKTLNLRYFIRQPAKGWVLVFGAKNTNTGFMQIETSLANINTPFTQGWYVLKDDGSKSDMDLFLTPSSIVPGESKIENIFSFVNGKKLEGKAKGICFEPSYKSNITGTWGNTRAFLVFTSADASMINSNTMKEYRNFNSSFYDSPKVKAPGAIFIGSSSDYFINDGRLHSIAAMTLNRGVFGNYQMRDEFNKPYKLSDFYYGHAFSDPVLFDENSSSFVSAGGSGTILNTITDAPTGSHMKANNNNKTLLYMGLKSTSTAIALLKDKSNANLKILSTITPNFAAFKITNDTLSPTSKLYNATIVTCNVADESLIYFVVGGNEVWSRNIVNKAEQLQYKAPAGETITYIRHRSFNSSADLPAYKYNYVMVGSSNGTTYNVRMFTKTAGNLDAQPSVTLTGKGSNVGDVFFLSPRVGQYTYNYSY